MNHFKAEFYRTKDGKKPAKEFMLSQDPKMKAKLFELVNLLEQYGNQLREPYSKSLGDGIFSICEERIILTNGFVKKMQEMPSSEIKKAKQYRKDFLERCNK